VRKFVVHAAKIPERFQDLTKAQRDLLGAHYVNACDDKKWVPVPDALFEPWTVEPCETCKKIIGYQPKRGADAVR